MQPLFPILIRPCRYVHLSVACRGFRFRTPPSCSSAAFVDSCMHDYQHRPESYHFDTSNSVEWADVFIRYWERRRWNDIYTYLKLYWIQVVLIRQNFCETIATYGIFCTGNEAIRLSGLKIDQIPLNYCARSLSLCANLRSRVIRDLFHETSRIEYRFEPNKAACRLGKAGHVPTNHGPASPD